MKVRGGSVMSVLGIGGYDSLGNDAKLIIERKPEGKFAFRILVFNDGKVEYDITVNVESEKVRKVIKFLDGVIE